MKVGMNIMDFRIESEKDMQRKREQTEEVFKNQLAIQKNDIEASRARQKMFEAEECYWKTMTAEAVNHDRTTLSILKSINLLRKELLNKGDNI